MTDIRKISFLQYNDTKLKSKLNKLTKYKLQTRRKQSQSKIWNKIKRIHTHSESTGSFIK